MPGSDLERAARSVMRAVDFVEERMSEDIGAQDMAGAACYSAFYFSRLFARATGHAPYDYLMRRRVAASAEEVMREGASITDIALAFGFDVPDTFARAFRRCFGCLPSEARRLGSYPRAIARTRIEGAYVERMLAEVAPAVSAEQAGELFVVGEGRDAGEADSVHDLAEGGIAIFERDGLLSPARSFLGACAASGGAAAEGAAPAIAAPSFPLSATSIPGGRRARFAVASPEALPFVLEFAYRAWLPQAGISAAPALDYLERDRGGLLSLVLPLPPGP